VKTRDKEKITRTPLQARPEPCLMSFVRKKPLLVICAVITFLMTANPMTRPDAWAGPEDPVPAGQTVSSVTRTFREDKGPDAPQPQKDGIQTAPSLSGQPSTAPTATAPASPAAANPDEGLVDVVHEKISHGFLSSAMWLDSFFGDERHEAEVNRSQLKVRFDVLRDGSSGMDYVRPNFDLRLVLPQLRHKTRLVISGDPSVDIDATATAPGSATAQPAKGPDKSVTTALQVVPLETKRSNLSIRAGLKFHSGKLEFLIGPRYRYLVHFGTWDARFTQEELWTTDIGFQSRTRFDLERPLPYDLFFRTSLEGIWTEKVNGYPYALSFLVRQPLDGNRALQYEWVNSFQTRPTDLLTEELLIFRYRQRFWRDWLFLEIAPQARFPRSGNFEYTPGILFRLDMVFGDIQNIF